jgi:hypothetical protein
MQQPWHENGLQRQELAMRDTMTDRVMAYDMLMLLLFIDKLMLLVDQLQAAKGMRPSFSDDRKRLAVMLERWNDQIPGDENG